MIKRIFHEIIKIDLVKFKKIVLYNTMAFVTFLLLLFLFGASTKILNPNISLNNDISSLTSEQLATQSSNIGGYLIFYIFILLIVFILIIYNFAFFENLIWNTIYGKKTSFKNTTGFLFLNFMMLLILTIISFAFFAIVGRFPSSIMILGVIILFAVLMFSMYILFVSYISFANTHKIFVSIRNAFVVSFVNLKKTIIPLIISFVISFIINLFLILLKSIPEYAFLVVQAALFIVYLAWFRLYLSNSLKSVKF